MHLSIFITLLGLFLVAQGAPNLLQRVAIANRNRYSRENGKLHLQTNCASGVGPTCGTFPIPANMKLDPAHNVIQPIWKVGRRLFSVYDPEGPACPNELVGPYGYPKAFPTTINGVGAVTPWELMCPMTSEQAVGVPLAKIANIPTRFTLAKGIPLPFDTREMAPGPWMVYTVNNGLQQESYENTALYQTFVSGLGLCTLAAVEHPCDLTLVNLQYFNLSAPNEPQVARARDAAQKLALEAIAGFNRDPSDPAFGKLRFDQTICSGGSKGGETCQLAVNPQGGPREGIPPPVGPSPFVVLNTWDASGDIYINASNFRGFNFPQVQMHSQNTGNTLGEKLRGQSMNLNEQLNSVIATKRTLHEMGLAHHGGQFAQIAVEEGYYENVTTGAVKNIWCYPNQTLWCFFAPAPLNNVNGTLLNLQLLVNLMMEMGRRVVEGVRGSLEVQRELFSMVAMETLQNTTYAGQDVFEAFTAATAGLGNAVLGGLAQEERFNNANFVYGYSSALTLAQINAKNTNDGGPGNVGPFFFNYADCERNGDLCYVLAENVTINGNPATILPQWPRWLMERYGVCPGGRC